MAGKYLIFCHGDNLLIIEAVVFFSVRGYKESKGDEKSRINRGKRSFLFRGIAYFEPEAR